MLNEKIANKRTLFLRLFTKQLILNSAPNKAKKETVFTKTSRFNPKSSLYAHELQPIFNPSPKISEGTKNKDIPLSHIEVLPQHKKYEPKRGTEPTPDYLPSKEIHPSFLIPKGRDYKSDSDKLSREKFRESLTSNIIPKPFKPSVKTTTTLKVQQKPIRKRFSVPITRYPEQKFSEFRHIETEAPNIDLGKLNPILLDQAVTLMECPGPGKFILLKKNGEINLSKITLNQEEIDKIIKTFSERARIPIIGGIFRAETEDLTINAVISGLIGSRFIIYRKTPYTILEE